jgi:ubiquinone/menaquinone biosynthesis C-methylase UbiE
MTRWSHGWFYHAFFDGPLGESRRIVVDLVPEGASVLDIASGTGAFCSDLRAAKVCRVVGVDLSRRMLRYAEAHRHFDDIRYLYGDATCLDAVGPGEFDYATILFLLHELPAAQRLLVLEEALRVARHVVVVESHVPFPVNVHAAALHIVEVMGGREHHARFADFLARGGIAGVMSGLRTGAAVVHRSIFWHGCRDVVVLRRD